MKFSLLIISVFLSFQCTSQLEKSNWIFGAGAWLQMDSNGTTPLYSGSNISTDEGTSTFSDENGNLILYTDGLNAYNDSLQVIENGDSLMGHYSSTHSGIIVPKPCSKNQFYIITTSGLDGINYSLVDMNLNNGLGSVIDKNQLIWDIPSEKACVILHENQLDYWLVCTGMYQHEVRAYPINCSGIDTLNYTSFVHDVKNVSYLYTLTGEIASTKQGDKIAITFPQTDTTLVLAFDNSTGVFSNQIKLRGLGYYQSSLYGACFSPNGQVLYTTGKCDWNGAVGIIQHDLTAGNELSIDSTATVIGSPYEYGGYNKRIGLELGLDNKIYVARSHRDNISVINYPDSAGLSCDYLTGAIPLDNDSRSRETLPSFPNEYSNCPVTVDSYCQYDTSYFYYNGDTSIVEIEWNFGDSTVLYTTQSVDTINHTYEESGLFDLTLIQTYSGGQIDTIETCVTILDIPKPIFPLDTFLCKGTSYVLPNISNYLLINDQDTTNFVIVNNSGDYNYTLTNYCGSFDFQFTVKDSSCNDISDLIFPNVLTPNGDGVNDYINFNGLGGNWSCMIYNRWGKIIAELNDNNAIWDGKDTNNQLVTDAVYFFVYSNDDNIVHGFIQVFSN